MSWVDGYDFTHEFEDLRGDPELATQLADELRLEVGPGHRLFGLNWVVVARALPQDDVVVVVGDEVLLVHLTWTRDVELPPWPQSNPLSSATSFAEFTQNRY
ncbi:MAG: hypothetical protein ABI345_06845 [Jatrophihabitans sp.]